VNSSTQTRARSMTNPLHEFSNTLVEHAASASPSLAAVRVAADRTVSAVLWQADAVVTSNQSLPTREAYELVFAGGDTVKASLAGRDPGTNVAALKLEQPRAAAALTRTNECRVGELALAYGADDAGRLRVRLGLLGAIGPAWHSRAGGRLARRIVLDLALSRREEGGPVLNAAGELIGMSTFGRGSEVLAIPAETIERVVASLLSIGHVPRGWLGLTLQPVAVPHALREAAGQRGGMMIMSVADDGPAARAGLTAGEILLTVDGVGAVHMDQVAAQLDEDSIGHTRTLRMVRNGVVTSIEVPIDARPAA
jgi:S1-C subfamily serine protease